MMIFYLGEILMITITQLLDELIFLSLIYICVYFSQAYEYYRIISFN